MEKDPAKRFHTPQQLIAILDQLKVQPRKQRTRRLPWLWVVPVAAATLLISWAVMQSPRQPSPLATGSSMSKPRVLIVTSNNLFREEFDPIKAAFAKQNIEVKTAAFNETVHSVGELQSQPFEADVLLSDVDPANFNAVVFVGGQNEQILGSGEGATEVTRIVSGIEREKGVLAAVQGGVDVLEELGYEDILDGENDLPGFEIFSAQGIVSTTESRFADRFVAALLDALKAQRSLAEN